MPGAAIVCSNASTTTEIYTLSLHDALPIWTYTSGEIGTSKLMTCDTPEMSRPRAATSVATSRSEEHTSELQSHSELVCRLLLEKKKRQRPRRDARDNECWRRTLGIPGPARR